MPGPAACVVACPCLPPASRLNRPPTAFLGRLRRTCVLILAAALVLLILLLALFHILFPLLLFLLLCALKAASLPALQVRGNRSLHLLGRGAHQVVAGEQQAQAALHAAEGHREAAAGPQ